MSAKAASKYVITYTHLIFTPILFERCSDSFTLIVEVPDDDGCLM